MRARSCWVLGVLVLGACLDNTAEDEEHGLGGSGGAAGSGGTTPPQGGTSAGKGGSAGSAGSAGAAAGTGGTGTSGTGGTGAGGSGAPTGGSGGSGACVQNLGCTIDALPSTGDIHQDCVNRVNQFRAECACLPPLQRWTDGEACADQMAEYDSTADGAHAGFMDDICSGGSAQNECPGWRSEQQVVEDCLQSMWDEGPPPMTPCNGACFQMYGHFINMTNTAYTRVACGFFTTPGGEVWAVQNFSR